MYNLKEWYGVIPTNAIMSIIAIFTLYKLIHYLFNKISIRQYVYNDNGVNGGNGNVIVHVKWIDTDEEKNYGRKSYYNNHFYFRVLFRLYKSPGNDIVHSPDDEYINPKDKSTYDDYVIITINKKDISLLDKIQLVLWLVKEFIKNKIEQKRDKNLPDFIFYKYIYPKDTFLNATKRKK